MTVILESLPTGEKSASPSLAGWTPPPPLLWMKQKGAIPYTYTATSPA